MVVCAMIFNALDVPAEAHHVWTEEFLIDGKRGGRAFNVVWLVGRGVDKSEETPGQKHVGEYNRGLAYEFGQGLK